MKLYCKFVFFLYRLKNIIPFYKKHVNFTQLLFIRCLGSKKVDHDAWLSLWLKNICCIFILKKSLIKIISEFILCRMLFFKIMITAMLLPGFVFGIGVSMPEENQPNYTPNQPTCEVSVSYTNINPETGEKTIVGECWIYLPGNPYWTYVRNCEQIPMCRNKFSQGGLGRVEKFRRFEDEDESDKEETEPPPIFRRRERGSNPGAEAAQMMRAAVEAHGNIEIRNEVIKAVNFGYEYFQSKMDQEIFPLPLSQWGSKAKELLSVEKMMPLIQDFIYKETYLPYHVIPEQSAQFVREHSMKIVRWLHDGFLPYIEGLRVKKLEQNQVQQVNQLFSGNIPPNWLEVLKNIVQQIEPQVSDIINNPLTIVEGAQASYKDPDWSIQDSTRELEHAVYERVEQLTNNMIQKNKESVAQNAGFLRDETDHAVDLEDFSPSFPRIDTPTAVQLYQEEIEAPVRTLLRSRYDRKDLSLLEDEELNRPLDPPYEFQSPEGEFLDKNQALYEDLRQANPYHEQGVLAREVGLSAVETADQEFAQGNSAMAEIAHSIGQSMKNIVSGFVGATGETPADIALGFTPYVGTGKDIYELFTGRHLLTGRSLTLFERSMSAVGIALSAVSSGVLNSSSAKLSLQKTGQLLSKINSKFLNKTMQGLSDTQFQRVIAQYPQAFLNSMERVGLTTGQGIRSGLKFVSKTFAGDTPDVEVLEEVIQGVGKRGIEDFNDALAQLKSSNPGFSSSGEEFLARKLRFSRQLSQQDLVEVGQKYSKMSKSFSKIERSSLIEVQPSLFRPDGRLELFRTVRDGAPYYHTEKSAYMFHDGMKSSYARYTLGENGLYTSTTKQTAELEYVSRFTEKGEIIPPHQTFPKLVDSSEISPVLDLTNPNIAGVFRILNVKTITKGIDDTDAYDLTQMIGHIARRKGFTGIVAPSAKDKVRGINLVIFREWP